MFTPSLPTKNLRSRYSILVTIVWIHLQRKMLHQARSYYASADSTEKTYKRSTEIPLSDHEYKHQQPHAESSAEINKAYMLIFLEIACKTLVLTQRDNRGIVTQESKYCSQGCYTRHIEQRFHNRAQQSLQ